MVGSLQYLIKSPASNGGGHVQGAAFGGTGQTTYSKGNILVASSASILSKLSVGPDGSSPIADSGTAVGIRWGGGVTGLGASGSVVTIKNTTAESSLFSVVVPGSTLGTNGTVKGTAFITNLGRGGSTDNVTIRAIYGNTVLASTNISMVSIDSSSTLGTISNTIISRGSASLQRGILEVNWRRPKLVIAAATNSSIIAAYDFVVGSGTEDSSAAKPMGITTQFASNGVSDDLFIESSGYTTERITS